MHATSIACTSHESPASSFVDHTLLSRDLFSYFLQHLQSVCKRVRIIHAVAVGSCGHAASAGNT